MAVDPDTISAGAFEIQFSEGKQIEDSNMYTGCIIIAQSSIKVVYHLESQSEDLQWWYEFAMSQCSPYLLRVFGKCKSSFVGKELLFTEVVEETLHDWVKKNSLIDSENPERLSKSFIGILGDIINGIIYFRCTLRQPHGEICANNVYLVNGKAKLGKALNPEWYEKTFGDDIDKFCGMVKFLFESKGSKLPFGLDHLCRHLQKYKKFEKYLMNAINHPIMLTPDTRCEYRLVAYYLVKHHQSLKFMVNKKLGLELLLMVKKKSGLELSPKKNSQWSWMDKIHGKVFETILHYKHNQTLPPSPPSQPVQVSPPQQVSPLKSGQLSLQSSQHQMSLPQPMHPPKLVQVSLPQSPKEPLLQFRHPSLQQRQLPPQQFGQLSVPSPQPTQCQVSALQPMQVSSLQPPQEPLHEQHLPSLQFGSLPPPQPQQRQQMSVHPQQQPPQPQQQPPQSQLPQTQSQLPSPSIYYSNTPVSFLKYNRHAVTHIKDYDLDITNDTIDRTLSSFVPEFMPLLHEVLTGLDVFVRPLPVTI